jgi:hypothetical protein
MSSLQKGKWDQCKGRTMKALRKDSMNVAARYVLSRYFFTPGNPSYQLDSAYCHALRAIQDFTRLPDRQREKLMRFPVDSLLLLKHRQAIDSAAFVRAMKINTEQSYIDFIGRFTFAEQLNRAHELRDEVAFIDALKENTYQSFYSFLTRYPAASRAGEARERYEKLLYDARTKDRKLKSYRNFLDEFPQSPYRAQAETQIFELSTASGNVDAFLYFMQQYPASRWVARARNIAYHLLKENEEVIPESLLTDSLVALRAREQGYWVPYYKDGRFGFMDDSGQEVIPPIVSELDKGYLCGNITEELLVTDQGIIARNGAFVYTGEVQELEDLEYGFILVTDDACSSLEHKSGFALASCIEDARVLAGSLLGIKENSKWTIKTLTGRTLPVGEFDDADAIENVVIVKKAGRYWLIRSEDLARSVDQFTPEFSKPVDEVKRWSNRLLWVRIDSLQGLWDVKLNEVIKPEKQSIVAVANGAMLRTQEGIVLWNEVSGRSSVYQDVQLNSQWIVARQENQWQLLSSSLSPSGTISFDSVYFTGPFLTGISRDSLRVYITPEEFLRLSAKASIRFLPGKDSLYFLLVEEGDKKTVYNSKGALLFTVQYDRIEYAGENLFQVIRREKRGLINLQGKLVVPTEYDAMGNLQEGSVPILKDRKFGYLDIAQRKEIKPVYEKNLLRYNTQYLIAHKNGLNALIDWNNKPVTAFEFEEIRYWNDSAALVRKDYQWMIYNFITKKTLMRNIRDFRWLRDDPEDKIIIIHQDNHYGVISNRSGTVLQATYSDIINLGSTTQPMYFTEKHVEEASIYVVIYYDAAGKLIRRQVFETDDYEKIYCHQ